MKDIILIFASLFFISCNSQSKCEEIKNDTLLLDYKDVNLRNELYKLTNCGVDSLDITTYFTLKTGKHLFFDKGELENKTYSEILIELNDFKKTDEFSKIKRVTESSLLLSKMYFNKDNWESDKKILSNAGLYDFEIDNFYNYLINTEYTSKSLTKLYKEFLINPHIKKDSENIKQTNKDSFEESAEILYAELLQKSRTEKRNALIFFFYPHLPEDEEAKIIEDISFDKDVQLLIKKYNALVFGNNSKDEIEFKKSKFKTDELIYFVIVNPNGEKIAEQYFTESKKEFINFLKKGIKE